MQFGILGPLAVTSEAGAVEIRAHKQRVLLALLLVHANEAVATDRLVDELWAGQPPAGATLTLQSYISSLRRLLEPDRPANTAPTTLITQPPGYLLRVGPDHLDVDRFRRLAGAGREALERGQVEEADETLRAALALWRGEALADMAYEPFAVAEAARLEELRLAAAEDRAEAALACGRHGAVVAELEALVAHHPLRERARSLLMLALYRSGRQADALARYREGRRTLVEELGVDPGPALQQLESAILRQDPGLDLAERIAPAPLDGLPDWSEEALPSLSRPQLVGRDEEVRLLEQLVVRATLGNGGLALVTGEPGIGKTRLVEAVDAAAAGRGVRTVWGRCLDTGDVPPFWPWVQVLRGVIDGRDDADVEALAAHAGPDLLRLLPELASDDAADRPNDFDADGARARLYDATARFLVRAAEKERLVVVLDDVHWADVPSLELLRFLAPQLPRTPLCVLATYRDTEPLAVAELAELAEVAGRSAERVSLGRLDADAASRLVAAMAAKELPADLVSRLHDRSGGNPFFLGELARLVGRGDPDPSDLDTVPVTVRDVIRHRVESLGAGMTDLLTLASLAVDDFRADVLVEVSGRSPDDVLATLELAMAAGIVVEDAARVGSFRFAHALVKDAIPHSISSLRRAHLHRDLGIALESKGDLGRPRTLQELAHHFGAAAGVGTAEQGARYALLAGEAALTGLSHEQATTSFERALAVVVDHGVDDEALRADICLGLGVARNRAGDDRGAREALGEAAASAVRIDDPRRLASAALEFGGGSFWGWWQEFGKTDDSLVGLLQDALDRLPTEDSVPRAAVLGRLAVARYFSAPLAERDELSAAALAMARRSGDDVALANALAHRHVAVWRPANLEERTGLARELCAVAERADLADLLTPGHHLLMLDLLEAGEVEAADAELPVCERLVTELRQPSYSVQLSWFRIMRLTMTGRFAEVEAMAEEAYAATERRNPADAMAAYGAVISQIRHATATSGQLLPLLHEAVATQPTMAYAWRILILHGTVDDGRWDDARWLFDELAADGFAALFPGFLRTMMATSLAETCADLGDARRAEELLAILDEAPTAVALLETGHLCGGATDLSRGGLLTVLGRLDEAVAAYERAVQLHRRLGARIWLARTHVGLAQALVARRGPGDLDRAAALARTALADATDIGMPAVAARAEAVLATRR